MLGLARDALDGRLPESETFAPDGLERWQLRQELFAMLAADAPPGPDAAPPPPGLPERAQATLRARGVLPHGAAGELAAQSALSRVIALREALAPHLAGGRAPLELDLTLCDWRLVGWIEGLWDGGLVSHRVGAARPADLLALWIRHLALCVALERADGALGLPARSLLVAEGGMHELGPVADAEAHLTDLLALYAEGRRRPLPFFAATSHLQVTKGTKAARGNWEGNDHQQGEGSAPAYRLCFRGEDPLGPEFESLAERVYGPLLAALEPGA